jgi:hypothetical protein
MKRIFAAGVEEALTMPDASCTAWEVGTADGLVLDSGIVLLQPVSHKEPKTSVISAGSTLCGVAFSLVTNTSLKVNLVGINSNNNLFH